MSRGTSFGKCTSSFRCRKHKTFDNDQQLDVRLSMRDATGRYDFYHAYADPGQKLDFTVTAVGTSVLDMYVNNTLVGETRLGTEPPKVYGSPGPSAPPPVTLKRARAERCHPKRVEG